MSQRMSAKEQQEWIRKVEEQLASGQSASRWCREHNISYNAFLYQRERFRARSANNGTSASLSEPPAQFKELKDSQQESGVTLEWQGVHISLSKGFDQATLLQCLISLRRL